MISIKDVAKQAGVAISTVSKVLNDYPNVSEETKKKVNQAVEELNFVPNSVAAALSSKQSGRVALLLNLGNVSQAVDEINMQYMAGTIRRAVELNLELRLKSDRTDFINTLADMEGVQSAVLVSYNGDYMG